MATRRRPSAVAETDRYRSSPTLTRLYHFAPIEGPEPRPGFVLVRGHIEHRPGVDRRDVTDVGVVMGQPFSLPAVGTDAPDVSVGP